MRRETEAGILQKNWETDSDIAVWAVAELARLAHKLRRIRRMLNLPADEVAKALGINRVTLLSRESGTREHSLFEMQVLALHYGYRITVDLVRIESAVPQRPRPALPECRAKLPPARLIRKLITLSTVDDLMDEYELSESEVLSAFAECGLRTPTRRLRSSREGTVARA